MPRSSYYSTPTKIPFAKPVAAAILMLVVSSCRAFRHTSVFTTCRHHWKNCPVSSRENPQFAIFSMPSKTTSSEASGLDPTNSMTSKIPSVSSRIQGTLDPCVVLMKELIGKYAHLWDDKGGIFSLAQGVVYWKPPEVVTSKLVEALQEDAQPNGDDSKAAPPLLHTYGPDEGLPALRTAIQQKIKRENALSNHEVMVTVGANQAYTNCILSLMNQDQKVVVFAPYYFNHVMAIQMALPPESLVVGPCSNDGVPDLKWLAMALQEDPSIHMVTLVNPGNPTGVTLSREVLQQAVDLCRDHGAWLTLDCTYEYFVNVEKRDKEKQDETYKLGGCFPDPHVLHIFSFSKSYAMAGYRCGYIVMSKDATYDGNQGSLFEQMLKVQDTIPIGPSRIAQVAALAAMQEDEDNGDATNGSPGKGKLWVEEKFQTLQTGRRAICEALESTLGGTLMGGTGAMYVMAKIPSSIPDDKEFAELLVKDYGVAVIPGSFCGFPGWIRVCYSNLPPDKCLEAAARLNRGLSELCSSA